MAEVGLPELKQRVSQSIGQVVVTCRKTRELDGVCCVSGPRYNYFHYVEAGIINGELSEVPANTPTEIQFSQESTRFYFPTCVIPVQRKLTTNSLDIISPNISGRRLRNLQAGEITFGTEEFSDGLEVYVGDQDAKRLAENERSLSPERIHQFAELLRSPEKIAERIRDYEDRTRNSYAKELTRKVTELCLLSETIGTLRKNPREYRDTREEIRRMIQNIRDEINPEKQEAVELMAGRPISFHNLGVPASVGYGTYVEHIRGKVLPEASAALQDN